MKRNIFAMLLVIMMLLTGCQRNVPSGTVASTGDNSSTTQSAQIKITAKGREYTIEEIQEGILKAFNTEFYYAGDYVPMNRNLILNKTLNYDLVFVDHEFQPFVLLIVNNLEHPWSTEEEPLYKFGIAFSEQGMEEKFYTMGTATRTERTFMTEERGETYLGSYSLHITEIVKPQHEQMSEEWKQRAEAAIRLYMDKNDFSSIKENNLEPGKYHVYIKGFSKADVDSVIVFEHENGNVYEGVYYFVHDISETLPADLNHVELVEDPGDSYYKAWRDRVRENAALHMEYWVQDSTTADLAENVPAEYAEIIGDYQQIVEFRLSNAFGNYEDLNALNQSLSFVLPGDGYETDEVDIKYRWNCMIIDMLDYVAQPTMDSFGYILKDMDGDESPELIWVSSDYNTVFAIFTIVEDKAVLVDAYWPRYKAVISDSGAVYTHASGGASIFVHTCWTLDKGQADYSNILKKFLCDDGKYSDVTDGADVEISKDQFDQWLQENPFVFGNTWKDNPLYLLENS